MMRGEPLVSKMALFAKYVVFPGAMFTYTVYTPPDLDKPNKNLFDASQYSAPSPPPPHSNHRVAI